MIFADLRKLEWWPNAKERPYVRTLSRYVLGLGRKWASDLMAAVGIAEKATTTCGPEGKQPLWKLRVRNAVLKVTTSVNKMKSIVGFIVPKQHRRGHKAR